MKKHLSFLAIAGCLLASTALSNANLIQNGSFEDPTLPPNSWTTSVTIPGWAATVDTIEIGWAGIYGVTGQDGNQVMELDAYHNVTVSQLTTAPSGSYTFSFLYAMRINRTPLDCAFEVFWNTTSLGYFEPNSTVMQVASYNVVAAGGDKVTFVGKGTDSSYGALIDNVQLNGVPDGGVTLSLFGMALAGLQWLRRKI